MEACPGVSAPSGASTMTYVACYGVALVSLWAAVAIPGKGSGSGDYKLLAAIFYGTMSIAYALAGIVDQVAPHDTVWLRPSSMCLSVTSAALNVLGAEVLIDMQPCFAHYRYAMRTAVGVLFTIAIGAILTLPGRIGDVYFSLSLIPMVVLWGYRAYLELPGVPVLKSICAQVVVAGWAVRCELEGSCGLDAYKDCWHNCPLPPAFNHDAFWSMFVFVGLSILAVSMYVAPDLLSEDRQLQEETLRSMQALEGQGDSEKGCCLPGCTRNQQRGRSREQLNRSF